MLKKMISTVLILVMLAGILPTSVVYAKDLGTDPSETVSLQEPVEETSEPAQFIPETSESADSSNINEDTDTEESAETSDTLTESDASEDTDTLDDPTPKCAFSFDMPLMKSANESIYKYNNTQADIEETDIKIESLRASLRSGASYNENGDYVWTAKNSEANHPFTYRISYALSGTFQYGEGGIKFRIPASILLNRNGDAADYYDMSVPHKDSEGLTDSNVFVYDEETGEDGEKYIVIYNRIPAPAAQSGYIEVAYLTSEKTFEYSDYDPDYVGQDGKNDKHESKPFYVNLEINQNSIQKTAESDKIPVCIDTTAKITSTSKRTPRNLYNEWQTLWGTKPADADNYYYLIWEIRSIILSCTQPYNFSLVDTFNAVDGEVVGYKMQGQPTYTSAADGGGVLKDLKTEYRYGRYDYVLTRHSKAEYDSQYQYTLKNNVTATVDPTDNVDADTSANSSAQWRYEMPTFQRPNGYFYMEKWGLDYNDKKVSSFEKPRRFDLDSYYNGYTDTISDLSYYTYVYGYSYPWTVPEGESADDPNSYGKEPVTYELTDNELYLKAISSDNYPNDKLTKDDYQFDKIKLYWFMNDAVYDENSKGFKRTSVTYTTDDKIFVYAQFNGEEAWVEVGYYSIIDNKFIFTLTDDEKNNYGASADGRAVSFTNTEKICTGYRLSTTNKHYYTELGAYPYVTLKRNDITTEAETKVGSVTTAVNEAYNNSAEKNSLFEIALKNRAKSSVYDGENAQSKKIFGREWDGFEYVVGINREGEVQKRVDGFSNNKLNQQYAVTWSVNANESYLSEGAKRVYVKQQSGKFYDLLPAGGIYKKDSLSAFADGKKLSNGGQYKVKTISNYNGSGRTMLIVDYETSADKNYSFSYTTLHSWNSIIDYGKELLNSVAYETGNADIGDGLPDDGGSITDKELMKNLDPDTDNKKFLYTEATHTMNPVIYTSTGLDKKVKAEDDNAYSYSTTTYQDSIYSYNYRVATDEVTTLKDLIFFDSLENYKTPDGKISDLRGTFVDVDLNQAKKKGVAPVVYYSENSDMDLNLEENRNLSDTNVWKKLDDSTDRSKVHAIAVDLSKDINGNDYVLPTDSSLTVTAYMKSPVSDPTAENNAELKDPIAYNNIFRSGTEINTITEQSETSVIHQEFTQLRFRVVGDLNLQKRDSTNLNTPIEGIKFRLWGTSHYGTEVDRLLTTPSTGNVSFEKLERGEYFLQEVDGVDDYLSDHTLMTVTVDKDGNVSITGDNVAAEGNYGDTGNEDKKVFRNEDGSFTVLNDPRIHGDLEFVKKGTIDGTENLKWLKGAEFRLHGDSDYGNKIDMYATSGPNGIVRFENIELGTYTMEETKASDGYINLKTKYTVRCNGNGEISIYYTAGGETVPLQQDSFGDYVIVNESYHSFKLWKHDSVTNESLEGAEFKLYGTSDYGTFTEKTLTTNGNGVVVFTELEPGSYILKELKAPEKHKLDENSRLVTVKSDGTVTIEGLTLDNENGWFPVDNERELEGIITVTKKWENDTGENRPIPVIHIDSEEPKRSIPVATINKNVWSLNSDGYPLQKLRLSVSFERNTDLKQEDVQAIDGVMRIDDYNTDYSVYFWKDGDNKAYWWSDAEIIYFPQDSSYMFSECSILTKLDLKGFDTSKVTDMSKMFSGCSSLTALDVTGFDTSKVTNMSSMFSGCSGLTDLDVTGFDTSNVTNMSSMFSGCSGLTDLDVTGFDTSNVTNMANMFFRCIGLTSLKFSNDKNNNFNTANVTDMSGMFSGCDNLTSLDVSGFNTEKVTNMSSMFSKCNKLPELIVSNFNTSNVTNMAGMFQTCSSLSKLDLTRFNTSKVNLMQDMFSSCNKLSELIVSNFDTSKVTNMNSMFNNCNKLTTLDLSSFNTSNVTAMSYMFYNCASLKNLKLSSDFKTSNVWTMNSMFKNCESLTTLDLSSFNTSNVKNMNSMFNNCKRFATLDLSSFDTSNVTDMGNMFAGCTNLKSLDVSKFNTSNVKDMNGMFSNCNQLPELIVSNFDTSNVTNMNSMFRNCSKLSKLDLTSFDTSKVTSMGSMFNYCDGLTRLDLSSSFDTSNVRDMGYMFYCCTKLESLDVSGFNTKNATNMPDMFRCCYKLTTLDLRGFNTSKVTNMREMFYKCIVLTTLDLSSFDTSKVTNMEGMFYSCNPLKTIYAGDGWNTAAVYSSANMFYDCSALIGGSGTTYDSSHTDKTYARIDDPDNGKPGYLTYKAAVPSISAVAAQSFRTLSAGDTKSIPTAYSKLPCTDFKLSGVNADLTNLTEAEYSENNVAAELMETAQNTISLPDSKSSALPLYASQSEAPAGDANGGNTVSVNYTSKSEVYTPTAGEDTANVYEKWIDNGDNTWTYRFKVYDADAEYYLWEEALAGYTSDHSADNPLKITYTQGSGVTGQPVVINTKEENPQASLSISKTVTGDGATDDDKKTDFKFSIHLSEALTGFYGDVKFIGGNSEITLKDGETKTAVNLPDGITYTVTEIDANQNGFVTTSEGASGTLYNGTNAQVVFTNNKTATEPPTPQPKTGDLIVKKTVNSAAGVTLTDADKQKRFLFTVALSNAESDTEITGLYGDIYFNSGVANVMLSDGESIRATGLPVDTAYTVTEKSYNTFNCNNKEQTGTITENTEQLVEFVNTKIDVPKNGFNLTKKLSGTSTDEPFRFYIAFAGLEPFSSYSYAGSYTGGEFSSDKDGSANINVNLKPDESIRFDGLPIGSTYSVTETESEYIASYTVTNSASDGEIISPDGRNEKVKTALKTGVEKVDEGEDITITYTNTSPIFEVSFAKQDVSGAYLEGATLQAVEDKENGKIVAEWESSGGPDTVELPAGSYRLHEAKSPSGYALANDIKFIIDKYGVLTVSDEQKDSAVIIDKPTEVKISKQDGYEHSLSGAVLQLTNAADGNVIAKWTSGSEPKSFNQDLFNALDIFTPYTLKELEAPEGYAVAQDISFVLNENGEVVIGGTVSEKDDGSYTVLGGNIAEENLVVMNDYKKIILPASGTKGELTFMLLGCLLLAAGCIYTGRCCIKRRKSLRRF